jgi:hypothetical protein
MNISKDPQPRDVTLANLEQLRKVRLLKYSNLAKKQQADRKEASKQTALNEAKETLTSDPTTGEPLSALGQQINKAQDAHLTDMSNNVQETSSSPTTKSKSGKIRVGVKSTQDKRKPLHLRKEKRFNPLAAAKDVREKVLKYLKNPESMKELPEKNWREVMAEQSAQDIVPYGSISPSSTPSSGLGATLADPEDVMIAALRKTNKEQLRVHQRIHAGIRGSAMKPITAKNLLRERNRVHQRFIGSARDFYAIDKNAVASKSLKVLNTNPPVLSALPPATALSDLPPAATSAMDTSTIRPVSKPGAKKPMLALPSAENVQAAAAVRMFFNRPMRGRTSLHPAVRPSKVLNELREERSMYDKLVPIHEPVMYDLNAQPEPEDLIITGMTHPSIPPTTTPNDVDDDSGFDFDSDDDRADEQARASALRRWSAHVKVNPATAHQAALVDQPRAFARFLSKSRRDTENLLGTGVLTPQEAAEEYAEIAVYEKLHPLHPLTEADDLNASLTNNFLLTNTPAWSRGNGYTELPTLAKAKNAVVTALSLNPQELKGILTPNERALDDRSLTGGLLRNKDLLKRKLGIHHANGLDPIIDAGFDTDRAPILIKRALRDPSFHHAVNKIQNDVQASGQSRDEFMKELSKAGNAWRRIKSVDMNGQNPVYERQGKTPDFAVPFKEIEKAYRDIARQTKPDAIEDEQEEIVAGMKNFSEKVYKYLEEARSKAFLYRDPRRFMPGETVPNRLTDGEERVQRQILSKALAEMEIYLDTMFG